MTVDLLARAGGLFVVFASIHFVVDFVFQSHAEAMAKHRDGWVRARHCGIYTTAFLPLLYLLWWHGEPWKIAVAELVLFWSHFFEDTYLPVAWWAKHIRKPPQIVGPYFEPVYDGPTGRMPTEEEKFLRFVSTPLGAILMVAIDQIVHLLFLWVPVALALL